MSSTPPRSSAPAAAPAAPRPSVAVLAPAPLLTITIEEAGEGEEIHIHPGGQGTWIARLLGTFDVDAVLCATFGGETGEVARALLAGWGIEVRSVPAAGGNGTYVHDRRSGQRVPVAELETSARSRHEVDELYGTIVAAGLEAGVVVLGGPEAAGMERGEVPELVPPEFYARSAHDLRENGVRVVADLSGCYLDAALDGGLDLVKVSDEDLAACGHVDDTTPAVLVDHARDLGDGGADGVVVTRAEQPALLVTEGKAYEIRVPTLQPVDPRGAGDSFTAATTCALARGADLVDAVRLGAAAGALNVTRRGLGSGNVREIGALSRHVTVTEWTP